MKKYIYLRVSGESQDYAQQKQCIDSYFARNGIDLATVDSITVEKHTGTDSHTNRKFSKLLETAEPGDIIYVSELSRIGRNMADIFYIVTTACNKGREEAEAIGRRTGKIPPYGVTLFECKGSGTQIENNSVGGKAMLFALSSAAELEVANIRHRTRMSLDAIKAKHKRGEVHISKSGRECTHLGNEKGCDMSKAIIASIEKRKKNSDEWHKKSPAYNAVKRWVFEGMTSEWILSEIKSLSKFNPDVFASRRGREINMATIKNWRRRIMKEGVRV